MKTAVSFLAAIVLTALCASGGLAQKAHANALVADLSKDQIRVASNFTGEKIPVSYTHLRAHETV